MGSGVLGLGVSCALVASGLSPVAAAPVDVAAVLKEHPAGCPGCFGRPVPDGSGDCSCC